MNITTAFLTQIKKQEWPIYHVESGERYKLGDKFKVLLSPKNVLKGIQVTTKRGKERVLKPNKGTAKIVMVENNLLEISFQYEGPGSEVRQFALRFFFFKYDPTHLRFIDVIAEDENECCDCNCCACGGVTIHMLMARDGNDDNRGTGGPHGVIQ